VARPILPPNPPIPPRNPPFPGGAPTGGGGGASVFVPPSNGGVFAAQQQALFPCLNIVSGLTEYRTFDPTQGFNDPNAGSFYEWRAEQSRPYRQATIRRVIVTFTDLGQVTTTWTLTGSTDFGQPITQSTSVGFGNSPPSGEVLTVPVDLTLTGLNLQLSVTRAPNAGPLSIVQVVLIGTIERNTL
jgi:hypothetical protein